MTFPKMTVPKKWLCTGQYSLLSDKEVDIVIKTKLLFTKPVPDIRAALGDLDKCCHIDRDLCADICDEEKGTRYSDLLGHPISCKYPTCPSVIRVIWSGSIHYPVLHQFLRLLYSVLKSHKIIATIDEALGAGDV